MSFIFRNSSCTLRLLSTGDISVSRLTIPIFNSANTFANQCNESGNPHAPKKRHWVRSILETPITTDMSLKQQKNRRAALRIGGALRPRLQRQVLNRYQHRELEKNSERLIRKMLDDTNGDRYGGFLRCSNINMFRCLLRFARRFHADDPQISWFVVYEANRCFRLHRDEKRPGFIRKYRKDARSALVTLQQAMRGVSHSAIKLVNYAYAQRGNLKHVIAEQRIAYFFKRRLCDQQFVDCLPNVLQTMICAEDSAMWKQILQQQVFQIAPRHRRRLACKHILGIPLKLVPPAFCSNAEASLMPFLDIVRNSEQGLLSAPPIPMIELTNI